MKPPHSLREFDRAIHNINDVLMKMAGLALAGLDNSMKALFNRDAEAAQIAIDNDDRLDQCELDIDKMALNLQAFFGPVACDLQFMLNAVKLASALERIGDENVSMAKRAIKLTDMGEMDEVHLFEPAYLVLRKALAQIMEAYITEQYEQISSVLETLECNKKDSSDFMAKIIELAQKSPHLIQPLSLLTLTARSLQNINDTLIAMGNEIMKLDDLQRG